MKKLSLLALLAAASITLAGCASSVQEEKPAASAGPESSNLESLIAAAQDEGEVVFYLTPPEATAQALADAFYDKYGVEGSFVRLTGGELANRYSAEAQSGAPAADLVMPSYDSFIDQGLESGILLPLNEADIPDFESFPEAGLVDGGKTAVIQFTPSGLSWNSDALGDLPAPETFGDLAKPIYKGKVLLADPASSQAYIQFWTYMIEKFGVDTVKGIADNAVRYYASVVPMTEALSAGEGAVTGPNVGQVVMGAQGKGAPVEFTIPDVTTGPEIVMSISAKAAHPNAARLFAHFVLSKEGQGIINSTVGAISAYNADEIPSGYMRVDREKALASEQQILDIFGSK